MDKRRIKQIINKVYSESYAHSSRAWNSLDLRNEELTDLPSNIKKITYLHELTIQHNHFTKFPTVIGELPNLKVLDLSKNRLDRLSDALGELKTLKKLYLNFNRLTTLPAVIKELTNLEELYLNHNQLTRLPEAIVYLKNLRILDLSFNKLATLPSLIGKLRNLKELRVNNNRLTTLPPSIGQLKNIECMDCHSNQLTVLPPDIGKLSNLTELNLQSNQFTMLPAELGDINTLKKLNLIDNPITIPPEILSKTGNPAVIITYYQQLQQTTAKRPLREAKLLIVGQGGVGKTQIVNRVFYNKYNENELKTDGIAIHKNYIQVRNKRIRLNTWDFGGQEIMHATHQFFLTKRSLYLLVWDARQEDRYGQIDYWLKLIQSFGADSPVIIVLNKIDVGNIDLDRRELKRKYPNIKAFVRVSCKRPENIEDLRKAIGKELYYLAHIDNELLDSWFVIKESLEKMTYDYIEYREYEKLCKEKGLDQKSQETLITFLHELGVVLNFKDDLRLSDVNILNPEWGTNGVYQILNYADLSGKGILTTDMLSGILDPPKYPSHKYRFILDMMQKFELSEVVWIVKTEIYNI